MPFPFSLSNLVTTLSGGQLQLNVHAQHHDALATAVNTIEVAFEAGGVMSKGVVIAPAPTGVAATDTAALSALIAADRIIQLQPGTYRITGNALTLSATGCVLRGWGGSSTRTGTTTLQLADQLGGANVALLTFNANKLGVEGCILDGSSPTIGSGSYWSGAVMVNGGSNDCYLRGCIVQNTARSGLYAWGYTTLIYRLTVADCWFSGIGRPGLGNSGSAIMLDGGCNDAQISRNRAFGALTSNFLKVKTNSGKDCTGTLVNENVVDYTSSTAFSDNNALAIEMWTGSFNSRVLGNLIYGPNALIGDCWGISIGGDARGSVVEGNIIIGGTDPAAMTYGIECASADIVVAGNRISNVVCGSNSTNTNPNPCHGVIFEGNSYNNCSQNGLAFDSGPNGIKVVGNAFVDCGPRNIFGNIYSAGAPSAGDGGPRSLVISGNTFRVRNQIAVDAEGQIVAIYLMGGASKLRATIADNDVGPYGTTQVQAQLGSTTTLMNIPATFGPVAGELVGRTLHCTSGVNAGQSRGITANSTTQITSSAFPSTPAAGDVYEISGGTGTVGMGGIEINGGGDVVVHHNHFDGARPDTGAAARQRSMTIYGGDLHCDHNTQANYTGNPWWGHGSVVQPLSSSEFDNFAAIDSNANSPYVRMYWDVATGRLHIRNQAGTDAAVGP